MLLGLPTLAIDLNSSGFNGKLLSVPLYVISWCALSPCDVVSPSEAWLSIVLQ
jgi:hypothetical protein